MKVAEKSNGVVHSTTERREEAVLTPVKNVNSEPSTKNKEEEVKNVEAKTVKANNAVKESEKPNSFADEGMM